MRHGVFEKHQIQLSSSDRVIVHGHTLTKLFIQEIQRRHLQSPQHKQLFRYNLRSKNVPKIKSTHKQKHDFFYFRTISGKSWNMGMEINYILRNHKEQCHGIFHSFFSAIHNWKELSHHRGNSYYSRTTQNRKEVKIKKMEEDLRRANVSAMVI